MDQVKIGKFIAERRKIAGLTQMQLAEKLGLTDRAISKWETGRSLPDSSVMLELCRFLGISVNDLLYGEVVQMENYNKEMENKLIEMVREKEQQDKHLFALEWVLGILSMVVLFIPIFIAALAPIEQDWIRFVILFSGFIPAFVCNSFRWEKFPLIVNYNRACFHLNWWQIVLWVIPIEIAVLVQDVWMGVPNTHGLFDFITTQHREREMDGFQISVCSFGWENLNALNEDMSEWKHSLRE